MSPLSSLPVCTGRISSPCLVSTEALASLAPPMRAPLTRGPLPRRASHTPERGVRPDHRPSRTHSVSWPRPPRPTAEAAVRPTAASPQYGWEKLDSHPG
eukprot:1722426-Rhodomonas_salina.2